MTRDDIIRMAREAWLTDYGAEQLRYGIDVEVDTEELEAFAALVAAAEREACARVCEKEMEVYCGFDKESYAGGRALTSAAAAIRARGRNES